MDKIFDNTKIVTITYFHYAALMATIITHGNNISLYLVCAVINALSTNMQLQSFHVITAKIIHNNKVIMISSLHYTRTKSFTMVTLSR